MPETETRPETIADYLDIVRNRTTEDLISARGAYELPYASGTGQNRVVNLLNFANAHHDAYCAYAATCRELRRREKESLK